MADVLNRLSPFDNGGYAEANCAHNQYLKSKQPERPSKRGSSRPLNRSHVDGIVKLFGFKETLVQQAMAKLESGIGYRSEDILDVIYQIEDEMVEQTETGHKIGGSDTTPELKANTVLQHPLPNATSPLHSSFEQTGSSSSHTIGSASNNAGNISEISLCAKGSGGALEKRDTNHEDAAASGREYTDVDNQPSAEESMTHSEQHEFIPHRGNSSPEGAVKEERGVADEVSKRAAASSSEDNLDQEDILSTPSMSSSLGVGSDRSDTASKKKKKKKKKVCKANGIKHEPMNESAEPRQEPTSGNSSAIVTDEQSTEGTTPNVWVGVRPKQPQNQPTQSLPQKVSVPKNGERNGEFNKLVEENTKLVMAKLCRICKSNSVNLLLLPCRHLVCCETCGEATDNCPRCDEQVIATVKTYLA